MVNVAVDVEALPHSSVAVKVTVAAPVAPQRSLRAVKLLVQVTVPQASVAVAPPLLLNHVLRSVVLPEPSHSTVRSAAGVVMAGAVSSLMVNVAVVDVALPHASVAVVTVAAPVAPQRSLKAVKSLLQVTPLQSSVAGSCSSVGGEPVVQVGRVAGPIAIDRQVGGQAGDDRIGCVLDGERRRRGREEPTQASVAVKVTVALPISTIVAQRREVIAPGDGGFGEAVSNPMVLEEPSKSLLYVMSS